MQILTSCFIRTKQRLDNFFNLTYVVGVLIYCATCTQLISQVNLDKSVIDQFDSLYQLLPKNTKEEFLAAEKILPHEGTAIFIENNIEILWYDTSYLTTAWSYIEREKLDAKIHSRIDRLRASEMNDYDISYCFVDRGEGIQSISIFNRSMSLLFSHDISGDSISSSFMHFEGISNLNGNNPLQIKKDFNDDSSESLTFSISNQNLVFNTSDFQSDKSIYGRNKINIEPYYIANGAVKIRRSFKYVFKIKHNEPEPEFGEVVQFSDDIFKLHVTRRLDRNSDGIINQSEIDATESLFLDKIDNFTDLQLFKNLKSLSIRSSNNKSIDLSVLPSLHKLNLNYCEFESINFSSNNLLDTISIYRGDLKYFDASELKQLKDLSIEYSKIRELDLSNSEFLRTLNCTDNDSLRNLVLKNKPKLSNLRLSKSTNINSLDLGLCPSIEKLNIDDCNVEELNLAHLRSLKSLSCSNNQLSNLDITKNPNLENLYCNGNKLKSLDLGLNLKLLALRAGNNQLATLDVSQCALLVEISIWRNSLKRLDISKNTNLKRLNFSSNNIDSISIKNHSKMIRIITDLNPLEYLDLSGAPNLKAIQCKSNANLRIDVSNDTLYLRKLECTDNVFVKSTNKKWHKKRPLPKHFSDLMKRAKKEYDYEEYESSLLIYEKGFLIGEARAVHFYEAACASAKTGNMDKFDLYMSMSLEKGYVDLSGFATEVSMTEFNNHPSWIQVSNKLTKKINDQEKAFLRIKNRKFSKLIPFKYQNSWGYLDGNSMDIVVEPTFETVSFGGAKLLLKPFGQDEFMLDSLGLISPYYFKRKIDRIDRSEHNFVRQEEYVHLDPNFRGFEKRGNDIYISKEYNVTSPYLSKDEFYGRFIGPFDIEGKRCAIVHKGKIYGMIDEDGIPNKNFGFEFKGIADVYQYKGDEPWFQYVDIQDNQGFINLKGQRRFVNEFNYNPAEDKDIGGKVIVAAGDKWGVFNFANMSWLLKPIDHNILEINYSNYCIWDERKYCSPEGAIEFYFLVRDSKGREYYIDKNEVSYLPK